MTTPALSRITEPQDRVNGPGVHFVRVRPTHSHRLDSVRPVSGRPCPPLQPAWACPAAEVGE